MATNRTLETRVEKLERTAGIGHDYPVIFVDFVGTKDDVGELVGVRVYGTDRIVERSDGESEREFIDRMRAEHRRPGSGVVLIAERRWADALPSCLG